MTTYVPFLPTSGAPFQFQATFDGTQYTVIVNWNVTAQRWYVNIYTYGNVLVLCTAVVASPATIPLQALTWANGTVTVTGTMPHGWNLYGTFDVTISDCVPSAYNGTYTVFAASSTTVTFPLTLNPGLVTTLGSVAYNISLTAGYFNSTLVFRESTQTFEITP